YEIAERQPPCNFELCWKNCAAHYLAIKSAESNNERDLNLFLDYINEPKDSTFTVAPLYKDNTLETRMILEIIKDDNQIGFGFCEASDLSLIEDETKKIKAAMSLIDDLDPDTSNEIKCFIDTIYLTKEGLNGERFMRSGTNFYMWGMMFLYINKEHSILYYADHIIHECAHTALNIINATDELVTNSADERFKAPLRKDTRPMIGLFHALFVLHRICSSFQKMKEKIDDVYYDEFNHRLNDNLLKLHETYQTVRENAKTTEIGEKILNEIAKTWKL
ncbi:TPA: hypothetical protein RJ185_002713, partial [Mannheimia haemolytica]|nr:hypothetical protein [Mannheimia haemolytica]